MEQLRPCPVCNGNDADLACAYPRERMEGCLRDVRLNRRADQPAATGQGEAKTGNTPIAESREELVRELRERKRAFIVYEGAGRSHWEVSQTEPDAVCQKAADMLSRDSRAAGEIAELREDAERYRWLRDKTGWIGFQWHTGKPGIESIKDFRTSSHHPTYKLDAAIDAALRNGGKS